jgi:DNA uptake protein ComE-like DNA-binding protein
MQTFDPNTVDSTTLLQLGLKRWEARTLIKYRNTGAKFRKKEDIKKLYFVNDSLYQALQPYIHITPDTTHLDTIFQKDTLHHYQRIKKDTILNLRTADTTELKMIPEIGSYRAKQIVLWRQQLGGFTRVEQILEARGMENVNADSLLKHFMIDSIQVEQLPINTASVKRLERHPYLRYEQAKAIYEYRRRHIRINSVDDLKKIKGIAEEDIKKIVPYLDFSHTKTPKTE